MKYLVVGGVAGGASAAARLRRLDEKAEIIIFDKGPYVSFSNCGLPYHIGGVIPERDALILNTPENFKSQYNIDVRVNSKVVGVDVKAKEVVVESDSRGQYRESYDKLLLSPGAEAVVPPFEGIEKIDTFILKTVPDIDRIMEFIQAKNPKKMTVIGAGFIGLESVENLAERGIKVTLVEAENQVLRPFDYEMVQPIHKELIDHGVELKLKKKVVGFDRGVVKLDDGSEFETDGVVFAIGVRPDTAFLRESAIDLDERGYIKVNDNFQTSDPNIYAVGDAILVTTSVIQKSMPLPLAGPANKQGRLAADHAAGRKIENRGFIGSSVIKVFGYTAACTGANEFFLNNMGAGIEYEVVYAGPMDRVGLMPNASPVMLKLIFEKKSGKVLGAQGVGRGSVEKRIDVIAAALKGGMGVEDLFDLELCYAPPFGTGKDPVNHIGYIGTNLKNGEFKQVRFTDVYDLVEKGAQIIDVREPEEWERGHIDGAKLIPMSQFRERVGEIDKTKPAYLHCRTGQRSYNVLLALKSMGYDDVFNIAGSYLFLSFYEDTLVKLGERGRSLLTEPNFS